MTSSAGMGKHNVLQIKEIMMANETILCHLKVHVVEVDPKFVRNMFFFFPALEKKDNSK